MVKWISAFKLCLYKESSYFKADYNIVFLCLRFKRCNINRALNDLIDFVIYLLSSHLMVNLFIFYWDWKSEIQHIHFKSMQSHFLSVTYPLLNRMEKITVNKFRSSMLHYRQEQLPLPKTRDDIGFSGRRVNITEKTLKLIQIVIQYYKYPGKLP